MSDRDLSTSKGILSYFTRHKTLANLVLVLMLTAGLLAGPNMRAQFFPDVVVDSLSVSYSWDGAGAEDVDAAIVQVLEPVLLGVDGVTGTTATSREGSASIRLEFEPGYDIEQAEKDIEDALDAITSLPEDAEKNTVRRGSWSDRVTDVVITGPVGVNQLGRFADELAARLFAAGVTRADIQGVAAPSTIIEVPSLSLIRYDIGLSDISTAIAREVNADPAGDAGIARVRTGVEKRSAEEIAAIVLRRNADGSTLTIGDVSTVRVEGIDRDRAYFVGLDPAVQIRVNRNADGDAIELEQKTVEVVAEMQATMPAGVTIELVNSNADAISGRLDILLDNGIMGLALVVGLLFLFLNARTAFWVAAGIPVAMLAGVAVMYAFGLTLNMISLFALILTLGIVVDDAIVVGEHADFRARRLGETPVQAAENAARRMFMPVFSATLTTVIAFFGLVAVGGRFGDLISDIPFTVIAILIASLIECFLILPNHLSHALAHNAREKWYDIPSRVVNRGFNWVRIKLFRPFMAGVIVLRYPVVALVIVVLASQVALFVRGDVQWRFFSAPEQGSVTGNFAMLPGATREDGVAMMRELQRATEATAAQFEADTGVNPIAYVIAQIGGNSGRALSGSDTKESWQLGSITISLIDADSRPYSSFAFVGAVQEAVVNHPMAETVSFRSWGSGPGGDDIDVQIFGADSDTLKAAAEALKAELGQIPEISGAEDSLSYDKDELILELTPQGEALGFTIDDLGRTLRQRLNGIEAASYPDGARSATIRVELPSSELTADFLDRTQMRAASGQYVPLADIVTVSRESGFSTVRRENGVQLINVSAGLDDDNPDRASAIMKSIAEDILPRIEETYAVGTDLAGLSADEDEFLNDALTGLILCLTGIYLTLSWIFSSWTRPIVVMAIIPFGLVGTIYGHNAWGIPMSLFTVVGMIGMVGIIINDSIVLVTTIDEYAENRGIVPAIIDGAADRLRPVFLTTATTVLGLAPLLYETSNQAQFLKPTVITLVYGLGFGMVLVLMVVPALMAMQDDWARQIAAAKRGFRSAGAARGVAVAAGLWSIGLFALLVLPVLLTGTGWPPIMAVLPQVGAGIGPALAAYAAVMAVGLIVIYFVTAIAAGRGAKRRASAA
ncbi:efflux RND transporter permease subunit [Flavimaricola marinus]|uniref:Multidrug resistance protein MexB n=1 Tax=Flavimaricola marinus TaxID=1819565 RepID=A0A238LBN3_9RHOB|nr:efflux RND transporter permease subunit [Flavimaricola marinus]SMY06815.1 Multidrug resistance protein MexB [Flavimaricola marinus]